MTPTLKPVAGTFMRLDASNGWLLAPTSLELSADRAAGGLRLGSPESRPIPFTELGGTFGGLTQPTGLAVGQDGWLFLADPGGDRILGYFPPWGAFRPLWQPEPRPASDGAPPPLHAYDLRQPRGVAFSPAGELAVSDSGHGRVILYTWPHLQPRTILSLPGSEPWDLAFDLHGYLYIADASAARIWRYDRLGRRDDVYYGGQGALLRPRHLALDDAGQVFVLDEGLNQVLPLDDRGRAQAGWNPEMLVGFRFPLPLYLQGKTLYLPQEEQPGCPALELPGIEVDQGGRLKTVGAMVLARPRGVRYPRSGRYVSLALDSEIFNCKWHRVVLDADIPAATTVTVRTLTAEADMEPQRVDSLPLNRWSAPLTLNPGDRPEALIQSPAGRYLWLRLELGSNGQNTPLVRAISLYAPRQSSLQYLPGVYHEDAVSADFLDRFLSYFDTIFAEIETQIEDFTGYLDPTSVPFDFLSWLGGWMDLDFLPEWSESTRRLLIQQAIQLYQQRGTIAGLQEILRLHTGLEHPQPVIIEHFRLRGYKERRPEAPADLPASGLYIAGYPLQPEANAIAHHFTVVLPGAVVPDEDALVVLHRLIDANKPAHTRYQVRLVQAGVRIGCQATVGVDMLVGGYPAAPLGDLTLGQSGLLAAPDYGRAKIGRTALTDRRV